LDLAGIQTVSRPVNQLFLRVNKNSLFAIGSPPFPKSLLVSQPGFFSFIDEAFARKDGALLCPGILEFDALPAMKFSPLFRVLQRLSLPFFMAEYAFTFFLFT